MKLVSYISASSWLQSHLFFCFTEIYSAKLYVVYEMYIMCMWIWLTDENAR